MKTCPNCGNEQNADDALMCGLCGDVFPGMKAAVEMSAVRQASSKDDPPPDDYKLPARRDFAREISGNNWRTVFLMILFPILMVAMGWAVGEWYGGYSKLGIVIAILIAVVYCLIAWFAGDKAILGFSGARPADSVLDLRLINVVDEMRIAAGLPMPQVYVIETDALNAFATGRSPAHATVAVTRGLMNSLNREELQAVVAHEIGHVRNLDIRYAMLVAAMVGSIVLLADGLRHSLWWGGGRRRVGRSGGGGGWMMLIALVFMILAPLFARLLQMAISRTREYLADASAVEFTRNPIALASALKKLDSHIQTTPLKNANRATQHLYIVNPLKKFKPNARALLSTHPAIDERIARLKAMG
ncbi:MAG: M48 family metallopeptidase [Candidatus Electryonea clarkiae]|nr:M48 family metallopeptidase [Candidatus Electryonea clarkiae]MDP8285431.1 M48 family metallopeptidase [Candidatus Electryonea clarkiae]